MDKHDQQPDADEPEAAAGELARQCNLCRANIPAEFFTMNMLSLLSLAAGMAFAFRLNRRLRLRGPFVT